VTAYAERAICYRPSVCLSVYLFVRPYVTRADQSKTVEVRIMQLSPKVAQSYTFGDIGLIQKF